MQPKRDKQPANSPSEILVGQFSKKEAAQRVADGCRHVHASPLGAKDPSYLVTENILRGGRNLPHAWETFGKATEIPIQSSASRSEIINRIITDTKIESKRHLKEKVSSVLEELMTNAIYHAYRSASGGEKYTRSKSASLNSQERVTVGYRANENGIYLAVNDQGGTLSFQDVANSFQRCYGTQAQIESKESGAGLGIYMMFEYASHLKIVTHPGQSSQVTCWLADKKSFDPENFSFNFFDFGEEK